VLAAIGWADYGAGARAMATGIPLHKGLLGAWNVALSAAVCAGALFLACSGARMWWLRRPARAWRLAAPPRPAGRAPRAAVGLLALLGLGFPLLGATLLALLVLDLAVARRVPALRAALD
jgi:uncharacterized iron-regulated membrane protein